MRSVVPLCALLAMLATGSIAWSEPAGELRVGAAASLQEPFTRIAEAFTAAGGPAVTLSFGASSALALQVRAGAPLDVLASADERTLEALELAGRASREDRTAFATNRLVALTTPELRDLVRAPVDLASPQVRRFAIPPDAVPAGHYARAWLVRAGLLTLLEPRFVTTGDVRAALLAVDTGHADAAIVYASDARIALKASMAFEIPKDQQPAIVYAATRIRGARENEAAGRFLAFLRSAAAAESLRAAGFGPPPPAR